VVLKSSRQSYTVKIRRHVGNTQHGEEALCGSMERFGLLEPYFERLGSNGLKDLKVLNDWKGSAAIDRKRARSIDFVEGEYLASKT
jgi:hypothetical protein